MTSRNARRGRTIGGTRLLGLIICLSTSSLFSPTAMATSRPVNLGLQRLVIETRTGPHAFRIEVARTEAERERGLMYRRSLPPDRGMLFEFRRPQPVMMWMKNTYVPLDMIFISKAGRVTHIARDAEPLSESIISSDGPASAVLEVNAGVSDRIGLAVGDQIKAAPFDDPPK